MTPSDRCDRAHADRQDTGQSHAIVFRHPGFVKSVDNAAGVAAALPLDVSQGSTSTFVDREWGYPWASE